MQRIHAAAFLVLLLSCNVADRKAADDSSGRPAWLDTIKNEMGNFVAEQRAAQRSNVADGRAWFVIAEAADSIINASDSLLSGFPGFRSEWDWLCADTIPARYRVRVDFRGTRNAIISTREMALATSFLCTHKPFRADSEQVHACEVLDGQLAQGQTCVDDADLQIGALGTPKMNNLASNIIKQYTRGISMLREALPTVCDSLDLPLPTD